MLESESSRANAKYYLERYFSIIWHIFLKTILSIIWHHMVSVLLELLLLFAVKTIIFQIRRYLIIRVMPMKNLRNLTFVKLLRIIVDYRMPWLVILIMENLKKILIIIISRGSTMIFRLSKMNTKRSVRKKRDGALLCK